MLAKVMSVKLFFSYSHADEGLRDQLEVHLAALKHQGQINTWHDRRIAPGDDFENAISTELEDAKVILLLISSDYIASRYCYGIETERALERHTANEVRVIPVVLRPCDWHDLPFGNLLALPTDGKPITLWANIDEAFLSVVQGIKKTLADLETTRADQHSETRLAIPYTPGSSETHSSPRSSNLRIAKSFTEQDRDDFLHEAFAYLVNFFKNSLDELSERNPGIESRLRCLGKNRFTAAIYQGGSKIAACTVYIGQDFGNGDIRFSHGEQGDSNSWNESISVDHDDQVLFLKPMGLMAFGNHGDPKLSMQGCAEFLWDALIRPLQE